MGQRRVAVGVPGRGGPPAPARQILHHPALPPFRGQVPGLLIKPAQLMKHIAYGAGGGRAVSRVIQPEPHPVGAFADFPDKGFIRMLNKTAFLQKSVQLSYRPPQMMPRTNVHPDHVHFVVIVPPKISVSISDRASGRPQRLQTLRSFSAHNKEA